MSLSTSFRLRAVSFAAALTLLGGCEILELSPNAHNGPEDQTNLTAKHLARLR